MEHVKKYYQYITENNNILNRSFGLTIKDVNELMNFLKVEYSKLPPNHLKEYIEEMRDYSISILKTDFSFNEDGEILGIENFPEQIKLYRIIDSDEIDEKCLGKYWTYSLDMIRDNNFQNSVGFDYSKKWIIIEAIFNKDEIDPMETFHMLSQNTGEREIRLKSKCSKPIEYKIINY